MTQEQAAEPLSMDASNLGRIERGLVPYDQRLLEAAAELYGCEPADLIMRNPLDAEAPWSIWEQLKPAQRKQAVRLLKALKGDEEAA